MRRAFVRTFLPRYLIAATIATTAIYAMLRIEATADLSAMRAREAARVEIAAQLITHDLESVSADVMVLALSPQVKRYVASGSDADRRQVTELFAGMSREKPIYDQIRFLDAEGMETVRVNLVAGRAVVVPQAELQPKGGRYFFRDSIRLAAGEIYVSPLDLNVEHGQIESPRKPMLRFGTPVFNEAGERKGVVLINVLGSALLDDFGRALRGSLRPMLLNRDGYWLSGPNPADEWGFMFGSRKTFASDYPDVWARFAETGRGSLETGDGLYSYATVYPLLASQRSSAGSPLPESGSTREITAKDYYWRIVSLVPTDDLPSAGLLHSARTVGFSLLALALLAVLVAYSAVASVNRRQWRRALSDNEMRLREITSTLGEGVYVMDREGVITFVNPEAERLLGWKADQLLGQNAHELFHQHDTDGGTLAAAECPIRKVVESGRAYRGEDVFWRQDGAMLEVEVSASPIVRDGIPSGSVVAFQDIGKRKESDERIRQLAYYDTLTGLPNRRLLIDRLDQALAQARRYKRTLALLFLDLDRFKIVNDTLGHEAGDELLKAVAARLEACMRRGDTVARPGGDEFVILLPELTQAADAAVVAEKIVATLNEPISLRGAELTVTASVGIAVFEPGSTDDLQELMKKADIAMYDAKAAGRNAYRFYQESPAGDPPAGDVASRLSGE